LLGFRPKHRVIPAVFAVSFLAGCSGPTKPGPVVDPPTVQSIAPAAGPMAGGTSITIRGTNFASGAAVTIGGRPATEVTLQSADAITARTPSGASAGAVDVAVTINGRTGTLAGGFQYEAAVTNTAPIIRSVGAQGARAGEPPNFGDVGETLRISSVVEDAETAPANLAYDWKASCGGVFTGIGGQVEWQVPASALAPQICTIDLIVIDGPHRVTSSTLIRVHDSPREMRNLAFLFLTEFATSTIPASTVVRHFSDACSAGKAAELRDVGDNRATRTITSHTYGVPAATIAFGGVCAYRSRSGDACVRTPVEWRSIIKSSGAPETAVGTSHISGVYRESRWWLCWSDFEGKTTSGLTFMD
jgi:hypothetical protein